MTTDVQKTLIILSPGFAADEDDSVCLPTQQLLVKALKNNYPSLNIIVLAFQYPFRRSEYLLHGSTVISFNGQNRGKLHRLKLWANVWKKLKEIRQEQTIIGLFSFWCTECAFIGKRFGHRYQIPHFIWILGQDARSFNKYVKYIKPISCDLIAISDFVKEEFHRSHGVLPAHVIYNGIAPTLFDPITPVRDIDILGAGSLIPLKQYDTFISVIAELKKSMLSLNVVLCGKGSEEAALKKQASELNLQANIHFAKEQPHSEILRLMQRTKIFLHTSNYEGFSTVCIEALYAGVHVISFCKPLDKNVKHWHIVNTKEEMYLKALELLQDTNITFEMVSVQTMEDSAKQVMQLFGYDELR